MKVKHVVSGNVIDVTSDHFNNVLCKNGWVELREEEAKPSEPEAPTNPPKAPAKRRGRPPKGESK